MTAAAMIADLGRAGIRLSRRGERLHVEAPIGTLTPDLRQCLTDHKADLLAALNDDPVTSIRDKLVRLADRAVIEPGLVHALPESELTATAEQIAACDPADHDNILRAYLRGLRDADLRRRGKVPLDETAAALCRHCGPVWVAPEIADAAPKVNGWAVMLGCPWCHVRKDDVLAIPRPPVACNTCQHYTPDTINPTAGAGSCTAGVAALLYPKAARYCGQHRPAQPDNKLEQDC